ncbi:putative membrane protein [Candidatus Protofrankia californiensis]|uniref:Putative membrane protein n=1 Tax=Candidatus Protofrankia californiensis TaxID=1839754 RepID=A0A1C3P232_9ACTN|nr:putative membrane protein [Candidatus Protofrankia californiensis]
MSEIVLALVAELVSTAVVVLISSVFRRWRTSAARTV